MFLQKKRKAGEYTLCSKIGGGRYGICYLAEDSKGNQVVMKKFRRRMWKKNSAGNHFEAVVLSGLDHPALPQFLGVVNIRSGYYFVLEYKEGKTLEQLLFKEERIFSRTQIYQIGCQLFDILEYLRARSVVHGDISIRNVLYDGEHISLIDFGLARYADREGSHFRLDYARTADVLIYLLYSEYRGKGDRPWYEELSLNDGQKELLCAMLDQENRQDAVFKKMEVEFLKKHFMKNFFWDEKEMSHKEK